MWDLVGFVQICEPLKERSGVESIAFSPDGRSLATATAGPKSSVGIWDIAPEGLRTPVVAPDGAGSLALSADGTLLATLAWKKSPSRKVGAWPMSGGKPWEIAVPAEGSGAGLTISHNGVLAAAYGNKIFLWNLQTSTSLTPIVLPSDFMPLSMLFAPNKEELAIGSVDGRLQLWRVNSEKHRLLWTLSGHDDAIRCLAFSPNGETIASGGKDDKVLVWNTSSTTQLASLDEHADHVLCIAFSPNGEIIASGGFGSTIKLWHWKDALKRSRDFGRYEGIVSFVQYLDQGRTLVSTSSDGMVIFWDIETGQQNFRAKHIRSIDNKSVAFSSAAGLLATMDRGGAIRLWHAATPEEVESSQWWRDVMNERR